MKKILLIILLYSTCSFSADIECFSHKEAVQLQTDFLTGGTDTRFLKKMATEQVLKDLNKHYSYLDKNSAMIQKSTEVIFGWGKPKDPSLPVIDPLNYSNKFPKKNSCVWSVTFVLPEKARNMCDDYGIYGYFFEFRKIEGKLRLYSVDDVTDRLPDGTLACEKMNEYLKRE